MPSFLAKLPASIGKKQLEDYFKICLGESESDFSTTQISPDEVLVHVGEEHKDFVEDALKTGYLQVRGQRIMIADPPLLLVKCILDDSGAELTSAQVVNFIRESLDIHLQEGGDALMFSVSSQACLDQLLAEGVFRVRKVRCHFERADAVFLKEVSGSVSHEDCSRVPSVVLHSLDITINPTGTVGKYICKTEDIKDLLSAECSLKTANGRATFGFATKPESKGKATIDAESKNMYGQEVKSLDAALDRDADIMVNSATRSPIKASKEFNGSISPAAGPLKQREIFIFHDAENCVIPSDSRIDGFKLYQLVVKRIVQHWLPDEAMSIDILRDLHVKWHMVTQLSAGDPFFPSNATLGALQDQGIHLITPMNKKGASDTKIKDLISELLDSPSASSTKPLVVLITGDRDFASDIRHIKKAGLSVMLIHTKTARPSFYSLADHSSDEWSSLIKASTSNTKPRARASISSEESSDSETKSVDGVENMQVYVRPPTLLFIHKFHLKDIEQAMQEKYPDAQVSLDFSKKAVIMTLPPGDVPKQQAQADLKRLVSTVKEHDAFTVTGLTKEMVDKHKQLIELSKKNRVFVFTPGGKSDKSSRGPAPAPGPAHQPKLFLKGIPLEWRPIDVKNYYSNRLSTIEFVAFKTSTTPSPTFKNAVITLNARTPPNVINKMLAAKAEQHGNCQLKFSSYREDGAAASPHSAVDAKTVIILVTTADNDEGAAAVKSFIDSHLVQADEEVKLDRHVGGLLRMQWPRLKDKFQSEDAQVQLNPRAVRICGSKRAVEEAKSELKKLIRSVSKEVISPPSPTKLLVQGLRVVRNEVFQKKVTETKEQASAQEGDDEGDSSGDDSDSSLSQAEGKSGAADITARSRVYLYMHDSYSAAQKAMKRAEPGSPARHGKARVDPDKASCQIVLCCFEQDKASLDEVKADFDTYIQQHKEEESEAKVKNDGPLAKFLKQQERDKFKEDYDLVAVHYDYKEKVLKLAGRQDDVASAQDALKEMAEGGRPTTTPLLVDDANAKLLLRKDRTLEAILKKQLQRESLKVKLTFMKKGRVLANLHGAQDDVKKAAQLLSEHVNSLVASFASKSLPLQKGEYAYLSESSASLHSIERDLGVLVRIRAPVSADAKSCIAGDFKTIGTARVGDVNIIVREGKWQDMQADVVVNAANEDLAHLGGIARSIADVAGAAFERECKAAGKQQVGSCFTANAHGAARHGFKFIANAIVPSRDNITGRQQMQSATKSVLDSATDCCAASIAIPLLGAGVFGWPGDVSATEIIDAICAWVKQAQGSSLRTVVLFDIRQTACESFIKALESKASGVVNSVALLPKLPEYQWSWQDDHGPVAYDYDQNGLIEAKYHEWQAGGAAEVIISGDINGVPSQSRNIPAGFRNPQYSVNFLTNKQKNIASGYTRSIARQKLPPGEVPPMYEKRMKKFNDQQAQRASKGTAVTSVVRGPGTPSPSSLALSGAMSKVFSAEVIGPAASVLKAEEALKKVLADARKLSAELDLPWEIVPSEAAIEEVKARLLEMNIDARIVPTDDRKTIRVEAYGDIAVARAESIAAKYTATKRAEATVIRYPPEWTSDDSTLVDLALDSPEFATVATKFLEGFSGTVLKVERVQNRSLYERYYEIKRSVARENSGNENEHLWMKHGTGTFDPIGIVNGTGLDFRYSGDRCYYGRALYLAFDTAYSDAGYAYEDAHGNRKMFIVRVAAGNVERRDRRDLSIKHPKDGHHSVQGPVTDIFEAIMTYKPDQAYPSYLVTYKRK